MCFSAVMASCDNCDQSEPFPPWSWLGVALIGHQVGEQCDAEGAGYVMGRIVGEMLILRIGHTTSSFSFILVVNMYPDCLVILAPVSPYSVRFRQGIRNFSRRMGRGQPEKEHLVFDVGINDCDVHFVMSINEKGQMVRRDLPMLLMSVLPSGPETSPCTAGSEYCLHLTLRFVPSKMAFGSTRAARQTCVWDFFVKTSLPKRLPLFLFVVRYTYPRSLHGRHCRTASWSQRSVL